MGKEDICNYNQEGVFCLTATRHSTSQAFQVLNWLVCLRHRLFMEILNSCSDCDEIQFKEDGNWAPMRSKKEVQEVSASFNGVDSGMHISSFSVLGSFVGLLVSTSCFLTDTSRTEMHEPKRLSNDNSKKVDVIDLTLDSSSEDELDDEPPPKRVCPSLSPISPPPTKGWAFNRRH